MEIIIGEYKKDNPDAFSGKCALSRFFSKAVHWLKGYNATDTALPEKTLGKEVPRP